MTSDNLAKIAGKGCKGTGLTEALARKLFDNPGLRLMAIVELKPADRHIKADGQHVVDLEITTIEPVIDGQLNGSIDEHVRGIQQALNRNRMLMENGEQLPLEGGNEPTVEQVLNAGTRFRPHPFLPVNEEGRDEPICDVCGGLEAAGVHSTQDVLPDPDENEPDDEDGEEEETEDGPHEYEPGPDDSCLHCGQAEHEDYAVDWVDSQHGDGPEDEDEDEDDLPMGHFTDAELGEQDENDERPATNPFTVVTP